MFRNPPTDVCFQHTACDRLAMSMFANVADFVAALEDAATLAEPTDQQEQM